MNNEFDLEAFSGEEIEEEHEEDLLKDQDQTNEENVDEFDLLFCGENIFKRNKCEETYQEQNQDQRDCMLEGELGNLFQTSGLISIDDFFNSVGISFVQSRAGFSVGDRVRLNSNGILVCNLSSMEQIRAQNDGVLITDIMNLPIMPGVYPVGLEYPMDLFIISTDLIEKV